MAWCLSTGLSVATPATRLCGQPHVEANAEGSIKLRIAGPLWGEYFSDRHDIPLNNEESVSISSPRPVFLHSRQAVITNLKTFRNTTGKDSYVPRLLWGECIGDQRCSLTKDKLGVKCVRVMIPSCFFPQSTGRHYKFGDVLQYRRQGFRWLLDNRRIDPSSTERGLSRNRKWD